MVYSLDTDWLGNTRWMAYSHGLMVSQRLTNNRIVYLVSWGGIDDEEFHQEEWPYLEHALNRGLEIISLKKQKETSHS